MSEAKACAILKKLTTPFALHHRWVKRRDSESLQVNSLQLGGPGWVPRCWCELMMAASMRTEMD